VAFYPQQGYAVLVELGAAKFAPLRLCEHQFTKVTEHVPGLIQAICADEYYVSDISDNFKVVTGSSYQTAKFILGLGKNRKEIVLKLHELIYLNNILYLLINQVARYSDATVDVASYSTSVMASTEFIETQPNHNKQNQ
jgi:lipoate synthase